MRKREGIEPRYENQPWMPTFLAMRKAILEEPNARVPEGPSGSETTARHQGRVGNSGDPANSSRVEVGQYNRQTGRKPDGSWEVGCPHSSDEVE